MHFSHLATKTIAKYEQDYQFVNLIKIWFSSDMANALWPVLYLELDIGKVCLYAQSNVDQPSRNPKDYPECSQLFCFGPGGPISVWTRSSVLDHLGKCIITAMTEESILNDGDSTILPNRVMVRNC